MLFHEAQLTIAEFLSPFPLDEFFDKTLVGGFRSLGISDIRARTELLGPQPDSALLAAFHLAPKLTFHSANPLGPPPTLLSVSDITDFRERIERLHANHYSVRFPELRSVSAPLERLARAFEILLHQPVTTSAFWSRGGMRAPVHFDEHDLLVVQLRGLKRWYISKKPSELNNVWKSIPSEPPDLGPHESIDVRPGDLLYLPRGTLHSVDSDHESLHLSLGFTPLTMRDALIAAVDHLSDLDSTLRTTVGARLPLQLRGIGFQQLKMPVLDAAARLARACNTTGFLEAAMQRRSARVIAALKPLPPSEASAGPMNLDTALVHKDVAYCHLTANTDNIDFSFPGGHLYIHRGAEESVVFIVNTPAFRVRDIPGQLDENTRLFLIGRFLEVGFLELASPSR